MSKDTLVGLSLDERPKNIQSKIVVRTTLADGETHDLRFDDIAAAIEYFRGCVEKNEARPGSKGKLEVLVIVEQKYIDTTEVTGA